MTVGVGLGNTSRFVTPPPDISARDDRRIARYEWQAAAGDLLPGESVRYCCRAINHHDKARQNVEVWSNKDQGRAWYGNLFTCGSVWVCPVCGAKITERRREELETAVSRSRQLGLYPVLITLTIQHTRDDQLKELLEVLRQAWRNTRAGNPWKRVKDRYKLVGSVDSLELTYSLANGWHPHLHVLFFMANQPGEDDLNELKSFIHARITRYFAQSGHYSSVEHGVDVRAGDSAIGAYVAKWGLAAELTKANYKRTRGESYHPFELLELYTQGGKWAGEVYKEYASAVKGRRQLRYSPGLRALLGLVEEEKTDQELAEEERETGEKLAELTRSQWRIVLERKARGMLLAVASRGDAALLWAYLVELGVTPMGAQIDRIYQNTS